MKEQKIIHMAQCIKAFVTKPDTLGLIAQDSHGIRSEHSPCGLSSDFHAYCGMHTLVCMHAHIHTGMHTNKDMQF